MILFLSTPSDDRSCLFAVVSKEEEMIGSCEFCTAACTEALKLSFLLHLTPKLYCLTLAIQLTESEI